MEQRLTGRIAPGRIRLLKTPRPPSGTVERFLAVGDPTGVVSDAMDELGISAGVIGASVLKPTIPGTTMVGPALTVRNVLQRADPLEGARNRVNRMAEFEAHNLASHGDVLVIQGVACPLIQYGGHLGTDRQARGRSRRYRHGRHPRHRSFKDGRLPGVVK
jgi:4-hydroxy-4-methyl-2-oxoglutarate aldolase